LLGKYEELSNICDKLSETLAELLSSTYEFTRSKKLEEENTSKAKDEAESIPDISE